MASLVEAQAPADEWLVIETTYHSSYGCYRGRRWSRAERICQDLVRAVGPFETREAAVEAAGGVRDHNEMFDDDEAGRYAGEPPWDSADAGNYDNDDEVRIEVKTVAAHEAQLRDDEQHMAKARAEATFEAVVAEAITAKRVAAAGKVHYSPRPRPYDIKADLEVTDLTAGAVSDAAAAAATTIRFEKAPVQGASAAEANGTVAAALAALCARCPQLAELHFFRVSLTEECVDALAAAAPHLATTLVFLRVSGDISPDTLESFAFFARLEHLDIAHCLTTEYGAESCGFGGYDSDSDDSAADDKGHPYNAGLRAVLDAAGSTLQTVDLGYGDGDMTRYLWDYCLSSRCVHRLQSEFTVTFMMSKTRDYPVPRAEKTRELMTEALVELAATHEDAGIRALAQVLLDDKPDSDDGDDDEDEWMTDDDDDDDDEPDY